MKSRGTRSNRVMTRDSRGRRGRNSPNGTGCCFTYACPGPVTGSQARPTLATWSGRPGTSCTVPTKIGTPIDRAAELTAAPAGPDTTGSISEEFSGQIRASGWGSSPWQLRTPVRRWSAHGCPAPASAGPGNQSPAAGRCPGSRQVDCSSAFPEAEGRGYTVMPTPAIATTVTAASNATRPLDIIATSKHPVSAITKDSRVAPPMVTHPVSGDSGWPNARRPHPRPPHGNLDQSHSCKTQTTGTASTHHRVCNTTLNPSPSPRTSPR